MPIEEHPLDFCTRALKRLEIIDGILTVMGLDKYNYVRYKEGLLNLIDEYLDLVEKMRSIQRNHPQVIDRIEGLSSYLIDADILPLLSKKVIEAAVAAFGEEEPQ